MCAPRDATGTTWAWRLTRSARAWDCAHAAYGESVDTALRKAACKSQDRKWLTACLSAMKVDRVRGQVAVGEFCKTFTSDCEADAAGQPPGRPRG